MNAIAKTSEVLNHAENKLVELAGVASAGRDYDAAGRILAAAQAIKRLGEQLAPSRLAPQAANGNNHSAVGSNCAQGKSAEVAGRRRRSRLDEYPRFLKTGDRLVKIAWSKTDKAEYEHKCPRTVLECLVSACLSSGVGGKRFSMDDILPLIDSADGSELPTYQIYVGLAWLKSIGLVEQHGRQGYSVRKGINLAAKVEEAWNSLS